MPRGHPGGLEDLPPAPPFLLPRCTGELGSWCGSRPVPQDVSSQLLPRAPGVYRAGELVAWTRASTSSAWAGGSWPCAAASCLLPALWSGSSPAFLVHPTCTPRPSRATPSRHPPRFSWPRAEACRREGSGRGGQLTVEAAHIQSHAGLLLCCGPLKPGRREGAGSPRALLLGPAHGLHEAVLTHRLEAIPPIIRHKPGRWE